MKMTEMNTEQLAKTICAAADPLSRIAKSKALNDALSEYSNSHNESMTVLQKLSALLTGVVPALLSENYSDMVKVISVMTGKSVEEVENQNGLQTIAEVKAFIDEDLADFFTTFAAGKRAK